MKINARRGAAAASSVRGGRRKHTHKSNQRVRLSVAALRCDVYLRPLEWQKPREPKKKKRKSPQGAKRDGEEAEFEKEKEGEKKRLGLIDRREKRSGTK